MTFKTKNFNVGWVSPQLWVTRVRFYMVAMKLIHGATPLAFSNSFYSLLNGLSDSMSPLRRSPIPFGMLFSLRHSQFATAFGRAISSRSTIPFSPFKGRIAAKADILYHYLWFLGLNLSGALLRTAGRFSPNVRVMTDKFFAASRAGKAALALLGKASELILIAHCIQYRAMTAGMQ